MSKQSNLELRKEWNDRFTFVTISTNPIKLIATIIFAIFIFKFVINKREVNQIVDFTQ